MTDALVTLEGASFGYGGKPVLEGVDLEVRPGELLGILGPNGAGKTTLFRGLLGLIPPLAGRVERGRAPVGYVPQRETLDPVFPFTAGELVHAGTRARSASRPGTRREAHARVAACLVRVGLDGLAPKAFANLSGGQRQRVLIARALAVEPRLLVLDEPTSGVDRAAEERILELLGELSAADGLAVLLVSHHLAAVRGAAEECLWVFGGEVKRLAVSELPSDAELLAGGSVGAGS